MKDTVEGIKVIRQARPQSSIVGIWNLSGLPLKEIAGRIIFFGMILSVLVISSICVINAIEWIDKPFPGFLLNQRAVVANIGQYHWTGTQVGLRYPDKILSANGRVISSLRDFKEVIRNTTIGDPIKYSIERGGQVVEVTIPTARFTWVDLLMIFGIEFLSGIIYLSIGVVVFILKPHTKVSWAFFLATFFLSTDNILGFDTVATHYGFVRFYIFAATFLPAAGFHLSLVFPEQRRLIQRYEFLQLAPYIVSAMIVVPLELSYPGPAFGNIYQLVTIYRPITAVAMLASTLLAYFKSPSILARQRAKVVLFGTALAFPIPAFGTFWGFFGGTLGGVPIQNNFFAIPLLVFPASVAYAIAKHNLFDVDVYIKRAVGYGIMTAIVGIGYFSIQTVTSTFLFSPLFGEYAEKIYPILFALLVVFLFNPINRKIQDGVDRLFFRRKFDYKETISSVSNALTSVLNLDAIIMQIVHTLRREMFVATAGLVILETQKKACQAFFISDDPNDGKDNLKDVSMSYDDPLMDLLSREKNLVTKYDLEEDPRYLEVKETCGKRFSEISASIAIPLLYRGEVMGLLALGDKKSGHFYTREDIDLLNTMANQAAIALENAKLFQEHLEKGRLDQELKIAHDIQVSMLPERAPEIEGFRIVARSIPAREVGGDFYDFIEIRGDGSVDKLGIVIGDVSGKGVSGALLMAASRSIYRVLAEAHSSVEEVMFIGNQRLIRDIRKGMFVALIYAVWDPKEKTLTLSNAGQTQPILCAADKSEPFYITTDGDRFPLGIVKDCHYQQTHVPLNQGDIVVFYTDGMVEAMNGKEELYGFERFMTSIDEGRELDVDTLLEKLMDDVSRFVGDVEQHDDLTVVVVRVE